MSPDIQVLLLVQCIVTVALLGRDLEGVVTLAIYASQKVESTLTPLLF